MAFSRWTSCSTLQGQILHFSWGRVLILLVLVLALLQVLHMILLNRLEDQKAQLNKVHTLKVLEEESVNLFYAMKSAIEASQVVDSAGEYKVVNFLYGDSPSKQGKHVFHEQDVTLITQCSINRLYHLIELSDKWQGPISISIFTPQYQMVLALEVILKIFDCFPTIKSNITLHLVYPLTVTPVNLPKDPSYILHTCDDLPTLFKKKLHIQQNYAYKGLKYPNNLLRNVALNNANTAYIFVIDIDMLPNVDLHQSFITFLQKHSISQSLATPIVYVVPAFEVNYKTPSPLDKPALLRLWQQQLVRPFYHELCWRCQKPSDYATWKNLSSQDGALQVAYEVEWKDPWEPFYIAPRTIPNYDTRFKQYGFNRISQVCEVHVAGYRFGVLNNAFLVHHGFKTPQDFHLSKNVEQEHNRIIFRQFKEELKTKYPDSQRRCY